MADRALAAERLASAVRCGEPICVFGDYDCDGITATAILTGMLRAVGGHVSPLLGSRFDGGYGVSPDAISRIVSTGAKVLVTCDCGSSDHSSLCSLRRQGVESIVVDHHLVPEEPPPSIAFLNPRRCDCGFPYKHMASCGLVLSLGAALRAALGQPLDVRNWLDLVALGTVADVVPLDGDNRVLVRAGLRALGEAGRPGIRALLHVARVDLRVPVTARDIAFRLAPRLNAPGRLGRPDVALELLLADTADQAMRLASELERLQGQRREVQDRILAEAAGEIELQGLADRPAVVIGREGWNHGVVGIVAGKLAARHARPVIVTGFEDGLGRGSVRGPRGFRLYDALEDVSGLLVRFGGHQAAAGLEVAHSNFEALREAFEKSCSQQQSERAVDQDQDVVVPLDPDDDPSRIAEEWGLLEPFGEQNPAPQLAVTADVSSARAVRGGHLKLELDIGRWGILGGFGPSMGEQAAVLEGRLTAVGTPRQDTWRGGRAVELLVHTLV
jgi:single-stranded-DNA-specific exonuclease